LLQFIHLFNPSNPSNHHFIHYGDSGVLEFNSPSESDIFKLLDDFKLPQSIDADLPAVPAGF
jgi:hypothetical protein